MKISWENWKDYKTIPPKEFICGFCANKIGSNIGFFHSQDVNARIYICSNCGLPNFFYVNKQYPGPLMGREIKNLPDDVKEVYFEIKESIKNRCFTAALLLGRKLIMHLAVNIAKAKEGENFTDYIDYLQKSGYIPPNANKWLDYIRSLGNEKNHEIKMGNSEEVEKILKFVEVLLIFIYEFPAEFDKEEE